MISLPLTPTLIRGRDFIVSNFFKKQLTFFLLSGTIHLALRKERTPLARVVELVDSPASGAGARKGVRVRLPPRAPKERFVRISLFAFIHLIQQQACGFPKTLENHRLFCSKLAV